MDFNDDHLNMNYDSDHSDCKPIKKSMHNATESNKRKNAESDLEAMQRTLVERKILLCNLQIDIAQKQLEALKNHPSPVLPPPSTDS